MRTRNPSFAPTVERLGARVIPAVDVVQVGTMVQITAHPADIDIHQQSYFVDHFDMSDHSVHVTQLTSVGPGGTATADVNIDGKDSVFTGVASVLFNATLTGPGTHQTFINDSALTGEVDGGQGDGTFVAGHGQDWFFGGAGHNTVTARDGYVFFWSVGASNDFTEGTGSGFVMGRASTTVVHTGTNHDHYGYFLY